jgi:Alpha-L-arabinofuranosidase B, catalytic
MTDRYIKPNGIGDGSSLALAAPISTLQTQVAAAIAGGGTPRVFLVANRGPYLWPMYRPGELASNGSDANSGNELVLATITSSGPSASNKVQILGMNDDGTSGEAVIISDRVRPYTSNALAHRRYPGQSGFDVQGNYIKFAGIKFRDFGYGCIMFSGGTRTGIEVDKIAFDNVRRGIWDRSTGGLVDFRATRIAGKGTSKSFIQLDGTGSEIYIDIFDLDGDCQSGDNFSKGIHLNGTYDGAYVGHGIARNFQYGPNDPDPDEYWNSDAVVAEGGITNLLVERVEAYDCTDGGFDIKAVNAVLRKCKAARNKRNYRLWKADTILDDCEGYDQLKRGGTGGTSQVWFSIGGALIKGGVFDNGESTATVFENEGSGGAAARIDGATIRVKDSTVPIFTGSGSYARNNERIEYTGPQPTLAMVDFLAASPLQAFSVARLIVGAYTGPLIRVRRASDGATAEIYPTALGVLDEAAIAAHCGVGVFGTIDTVYNQASTGIGGSGNWTTTATSRQERIYDGTGVVKKNSKPHAFCDAEDRGYRLAASAHRSGRVDARSGNRA